MNVQRADSDLTSFVVGVNHLCAFRLLFKTVSLKTAIEQQNCAAEVQLERVGKIAVIVLLRGYMLFSAVECDIYVCYHCMTSSEACTTADLSILRSL